MKDNYPHIAVIIPCFNVEKHIDKVVFSIPDQVRTIVVIDDCSTDQTRSLIEKIKDQRVVKIFHEKNQGVGGAVISGYKAALDRGAEICVKMDGDGQMSSEDLDLQIFQYLKICLK